MKRAIIACAVVASLSGCASIFNGTTQAVTIHSAPAGAAVIVSNRDGKAVHNGSTPLTVTLNRGAGYFRAESYRVAMQKDGFADITVPIDGTVSGWYIGNILFGGLIGMLAVDPATGGMYTFPDTVSGTLIPAPSGASVTAPAASRVVARRTGRDTFNAERLAKLKQCGVAPVAHLVDAGPGFENYDVPCDAGPTLTVRCEFGNCRAL